MILKIERHNCDQDWWLFDNIAKISCSKAKRHTMEYSDTDPLEDRIRLFDHQATCTCGENEGCEKCISFYRLVCRTNDWEEFSVVFDTVAYICNDSGKTVEKIVANHGIRNSVVEETTIVK